MNNMNSHSKRIGTIFVFSILLVLVSGFAPSMFINVNALDFDVSDFECIAPVGNIGDNICSEDNSVTQETNNVDNSVTDNSDDDTTISDSFNTSFTQTCGNNSASENSSVVATGNNVTCEIANGVPAIAPSTLSFS